MTDYVGYRKHTIEIHQDPLAENPRDWDNLGTMVCFHKRYDLGDKHNFNNPKEVIPFLSKDEQNFYTYPLYLFDHSGITIRSTPFSCGWDSGQIGWIYITEKKAKQELKENITSKEIYQYLDSEISTYDNYLQGFTYGYTIPEFEKSCWGYYGNDHEKSGLLQDAKSVIDFVLKRRREIKHKQIKAWIKHNVPFQYRTLKMQEISI